jgi:hypothetical protein
MKALLILTIASFSVFASNDCEYLLTKDLMENNSIISIKLNDYDEAARVAMDRGNYDAYTENNEKYGEIKAQAQMLAKAVCE